MKTINRTRRRRLTVGLAAASAVGLGIALGAPALAAASHGYVALGDSYSSGTGTRSYLPDGTQCQRSVYAYPAIDAASLGLSLSFRACSGATVADVTTTQLPALTADTGYVTISVGGNDIGFSSVISTCALPSWLGNCNRAVDGAQATITNVLPSRLTALYAAIRAKAPGAKVIVAGYPRLFNGDDCNAFTWFSSSEEARLNQTADLLNARTAAAATAAGFTFVNPTSSFTGHAVCDRSEWLNGLSFPITESFHPNRSGHANGYAPLTRPAFALPVALRPDAARAEARSQARSLTRQSARWAALDSSITPKPFVKPDLTTAKAKAAARAAGVDLSSRASIDRADRVFQARQDAARAAQTVRP